MKKFLAGDPVSTPKGPGRVVGTDEYYPKYRVVLDGDRNSPGDDFEEKELEVPK